MKRSIFFCLFASIVVGASFVTYDVKHSGISDCENAKTSADDAYSYFKKAYNASSLDDAQYYAKKGMNSSSDAESEAQDSECDCDDAASAADDAYSYGKRSYNADDLSDAQYYAKKAMNSSEEVIDEAENCEAN